MRPDVVERRLNSIPDLSRQGKPINGLFRLLACPTIWERAYEAIAPNKGALTPGTDVNNTLDGFSLERVDRIIGEVMSGTYRFSPARRHYIPKPNGKLRPLGIPTADDKLVQSAVKLLLERVYEPVFSNRSHGFRRGRSCHTALEQIKRQWTGVKWLVEIDVVSFFDNVDHDILLDLLREKIADDHFVGLIGRMLKAGYMEDWTLHETFSGTPQGGVISPILANIYLHTLDQWMEDRKARFDQGKKRRPNPEYLSLNSKIRSHRRTIDRRRVKGDDTETPTLLAKIRELELRRREVPCSDWFDPDYRRLLYCRYADDFIIGIIGSKEDARQIEGEVKTFLTERLRLRASEEKGGISKATEGATFLGYTVRTHDGAYWRPRTINGRTGKLRVTDRVQLHAPHDKLIQFVERKRLGNYHTNRGVMRTELQDNADLTILAGYNALMRGLAEYYKLGTSWRHELQRVQRIWWWSLMKTLARKHRCSVARIAQKLRHGDRIGLWYEADGKRRFMAVFRLADIEPTPTDYTVDRYPREIPFFQGRNEITDRLKARKCEACGTGDQPVQVHHARRMADMKGTTLWTHIRAARTRKRIVLCRDCHAAHHAGRLKARLDMMGVGVGAV